LGIEILWEVGELFLLPLIFLVVSVFLLFGCLGGEGEGIIGVGIGIGEGEEGIGIGIGGRFTFGHDGWMLFEIEYGI